MISQFKNDPNTTTDDYIAKAAATNDLLSTVSGSIVSIAGAIVPFIIMFTPGIPESVKIAAIGGGMITGGAGALIARQQPQSLQQIASDRIKQQSQSSDEGQF
jgi:hypothetical protein